MINDCVGEYILLSFSIQKKGRFLIHHELVEQLTYEQYYALFHIYNQEKVTSSALAQWLNVNKSAITALIRRLEEKQLVLRERIDEDRRIVYLSLSQKGTQLYEECQQRIHMLVQNLVSAFDEEELDHFIQTYKKINELLDEKIAEMKG